MPKRVVVLEDEQVLYELLHDLLQFEGYQVSRPEHLENLIDDLQSKLPAAVLIDVNLRGASGLDLLDQIRADSKLKNIPVLLTSGLDYRQECLAHGADGFLMKPYMPDELVQLLKQTVKQ